MKEMKKRAKTMGEWPPIIIFPEGTCTNRSCLIGFKQGKDVGKFLSKCTR
jgi:lysophosphatidylcholine acyltransferase/lyso-PAF acetyltransferase